MRIMDSSVSGRSPLGSSRQNRRTHALARGLALTAVMAALAMAGSAVLPHSPGSGDPAEPVSSHPAIAPKTPPPNGFSDRFWSSDLAFEPLVLTVFDDGTGPALYAGGTFGAAGGAVADGVAKWNGTAWSGLAATGVSGTVAALTVFNDGSGPALYAAGSFLTMGGTTVNNVAKWNGTTWSPLTGPSGVGLPNTTIFTLAVWDDGSGPALWAGGELRSVGNPLFPVVAKWDGQAWSSSAGFSAGDVGFVSTLTPFDDGTGTALFAGGSFARARGLTVGNVAKWNGTSWSALAGPMGTGVSGTVNTLAVFDDGGGAALWAGGFFTQAGGLAVGHFAKWNGTAWSNPTPVASDRLSAPIRRLHVHDDGTGAALYAAGDFRETQGHLALGFVGKWSGSSWSALNGPLAIGLDGPATGLTSFDDGGGPALHVVGILSSAGGHPANHVAKWRPEGWSALSTATGAGVWDEVAAMAIFDDGGGPDLYATGSFRIAGGDPVGGLARWNGTAWSAVVGSTGLQTAAGGSALAVHDDGSGAELYLAAPLALPGGGFSPGVAKWNGSDWTVLEPSGSTTPPGFFEALTFYDSGDGPELYGGGLFFDSGAFNHVARWDGAAWQPLSDGGGTGVGVSGEVRALAVYDAGDGPALYVGGLFIQAGGVPSSGLAKWDGSTWSDVPDLPGSAQIRALAVYDDGTGPKLVASGTSGVPGEQNYVATWDGTAWTVLAHTGQASLSGRVLTLTAIAEGGGQGLYAGGEFTTIGNVAANRIARWDGSAWRTLDGPAGSGVNRTVRAIAGAPTGARVDVWVGGRFETAGGIASTNVALWNGDPSALFQDGFESGDLAAWTSAVGAAP